MVENYVQAFLQSFKLVRVSSLMQEDDLQLAIRLSQKEEEERLKACKEQEEELERIIKLSLTEK